METQNLEQSNTEAEYKSTIKELALTDNANGYLYLSDGKMAVAFNSLDTADFALPLTITHVHKQGGAETAYGQNWRLNVNRKLKLNSDDTDKNTRYVYTDELGDTHVFSEEYYYMTGEIQHAIEDKSQINIDVNGGLTYNGKQVYKKQHCKGYTLIPEINDYKGYELIEQRNDERIALEEYLLQTEPELKGYVRVNAESGALSEDNVNFTAAGSLTKESCQAFLDGVTADSDDIIIKETELLKWSAESKQALIDAARKNLKKVKYEFLKYFKKKAELDLLILNTPVCYLKDGSGIISGFNSDGDFVCIIDGYGRYLAIDYGANGRINSIYDGNGSAAEFAYDNGLLKSITDRLGRKVSFTYTQNLLTKVSFADGSTITFGYSSGQISTVESSNCPKTKLYYNSGRLSSMSRESTSPRYGVIEYISITYQSNGITLAKNGEREIYTFYADGRVATRKIEEPTNKSTTVTYTYTDSANGYSVKATTSDNAGNKTLTITREYDKAEKIKSEKTDWVYKNKSTTVKTITTITEYTYDLSDRLTKKRTTKDTIVDYDPDGDSTNEYVNYFVEKYTYDLYGNLVLTESYVEGEEKTSGVNFEERVYNDNGVMVKCIRWNSLDSSSKFYEEYECEKDGKVKYEKDETGAYSAMYEYADGKNIVNSVTYANGGKLGYGRNPYNNQLTSVTASTADGEANSNEIEYEYGLPAKVTSGNTSIEYSYDHKGRKTAVVVNGATQWTCSYNDVNEFDDDDTFTYGNSTERIYTGDGDVKIINGKCTTDTGESIAHVKEYIIINGVTEYSTEYNGKGLIKTQTYKDADRIQRYTNYSYDEYDNLTLIETRNQSASGTLISKENYTYDDFGTLSVKQITGQTTHTYYYFYKNNGARDLESVNFVMPNTSDIYKFKPLKDVNGRNTGKEIYNGSNKLAGEYVTYRKVGDHATKMPATVWFANGTKIKDSIKYKYDSCGNISEITENGHLVARYTYDALNRLIREDNKPLNKTVIFTYDSAGNITERCEYGFTLFSEESLAAQDCTHYSYDYEGDKLVSYNGAVCTYNNIGNPTKYRNNVCEWQYGNRLTKYGSTTFAYDSLGRRTKKTSDDTTITYTYDSDGRIIKQSNGLEFIYDANGVAGFKYEGAIYFYRKDAQGNIIAILDTNSKVITKYVYDAWGNCTTLYLHAGDIEETYQSTIELAYIYTKYKKIADLNPFRYRGYYYDTETELYYLQSRYYDPEVGRFISQDSIEYADPEAINGLNLYAYCGNNPVMNVDPSGEAFLSFLIFSIVLGAVIGGAFNTYKAHKEGASDWGLVGAFLGGAIMGGAMGAVMAIGGAAGFASLGLTTTVVGGSSLAAFGISVGIGIGAGLASYTVETSMRKDKPWNWGEFAVNGLVGGIQAAATFWMSFAWGRAGLFNSSLTKMSDAMFLQYLVDTTGKITTGQALVYSANFLVTNFIARFFLSTIPSAIVRGLISKMMKG